jgi:hypothetical protein
MATEWLEILVLLHGITPTPDECLHTADYALLKTNIEKIRQKDYPDKPKFWSTIELEWGSRVSNSAGMDAHLAEVQRKVMRYAAQADVMPDQDWWSEIWAPLRFARPRLRDWLILGVADLFYYVSKDGEAAIRQHVFNCLNEAVKGCLAASSVPARGADGRDHGVSLTFVGHSAGGIILHDLLYHLFRDEGEHAAKPGATRVEREAIDELRDLVHRDRRLRVRRLYTLGSPITPLVFRADSLIRKLRDDLKLAPADIGLSPDPALPNPRWVNLVDIDDPAAYPVAFLYDTHAAGQSVGIVQDRQVDVGDNPFSAHRGYWSDRSVAKIIVQTL